MADNSVLAKLKKLDEERAKLLNEAKKQALANVQTAIAELNSLGFNYRIVEGGKAPISQGSRVGTRGVKDAPCPICGFKTNPPHDKRSHRTQEPKKPFTEAELKAKGMRKS